MFSRFRHAFVLCLIALTFLAGAQTKPGQIVKIEPHDTVEVDLGPSIDTRKILPQINTEITTRPKSVGNRFWFEPERESVPPNNLPVGNVTKEPLNPVLNALWPAITATGWNPPDPTLAVGPNNVVVTVNSSVAFYSRTGTVLFQQTLGTFFSGLWESSRIFDPKVFYDKQSGRYFLLALEQEDARQISKLLLAVSDDNDPAGTWHRYRIESRLLYNGNQHWFDYPGFGFNKDAIAISGNMFSFANDSFGAVLMCVIPKAPLLAGSPVSATRFVDLDGASYQVAEIADPTVTSIHGISRRNTGFAKWFTITTPAAGPTLHTGLIAIPTFTYPSVGARSRSTTVDPLDGRLLNATYRNGRVLAAHTIRTSTDSTNRVRWYEFNFISSPSVAPFLVQSGDVAGPTGTHYFMPAINKNSAGDISVIFTRSSADITADIMIAGRYTGDALGTMRAPVNLKSSDAVNYTSGYRWGDYFQVNVDPNDEHKFWGVAMNAGADGKWQTHVVEWNLTAALLSVTAVNTIVAGNSGTLRVKLSSRAKPGGQTVALSSNSSALSVPNSVTVPGGSFYANVTFTTSAVVSNTSATVTATMNGISRQKTIVVTPAGLTGISVPPLIASGQSATGTVTFGGGVPLTGAVIALNSSDPNLVVPSSVTVPFGSQSASFPISTTKVGAPRSVVVGAEYDRVTRTASTVLRAPELVSVTAEPATTIGGTTGRSILTVTLSSEAPKGGITVNLSSSNPAITVPETLRIVEGQISKTLSLSAQAVAEDVNVSVGASWQGTTRLRTIQVRTARPRGFSITPNVFIGGSETVVRGRVVLDGPAAPGGKTITLSSYNPAALSAPPTVEVPAGATSVEFDLSHFPVTVDRIVRIQATASGWSIWSGNATVRPPFSVVVAPESFVGGSEERVTGTIRLNAIRNTPTLVTLISSAPGIASVPTTITIPAGVSSRSFAISHKAVTVARTVRITASIDGVELKSNAFTLTP